MIKTLFAGLLLCLCALGAAGPSLAQADRDAGNDPLLRLQREGWGIVQDGVLRRELKANETETFVFGVEGFTWKLRDLRSQLQVLRREFKTHPTPELRRAIASHRKAIASTLETIERARAAEASGETKLTMVTCQDSTNIFAYDADAFMKTEHQGTWANASADFYSDLSCNFTGEVYAYAFAKATMNGASTTATVTDGPRSGSDVNASADANRKGGFPCESYAYASVTSNEPTPSSYSRSKSNEDCTLPSPSASPLQVSVTSNQPSTINLSQGDCVTITWTVSISGGTPAYRSKIYRNDIFVKHGLTYSEFVCDEFTFYDEITTIRAEVIDNGGQSRSVAHTTTIYYAPPPECDFSRICTF